MGRRLDLLPVPDAPPAFVSRGRADVVVEGPNAGRAGCLAQDRLAFGVVVPDHLFVVVEIEIGPCEGPVQQLEAVDVEGAPPPAFERPRVADRYRQLLGDDALVARVVAIAVAPGEHLAVAIERRLRFRRHVAHEAGGPCRTLDGTGAGRRRGGLPV